MEFEDEYYGFKHFKTARIPNEILKNKRKIEILELNDGTYIRVTIDD